MKRLVFIFLIIFLTTTVFVAPLFRGQQTEVIYYVKSATIENKKGVPEPTEQINTGEEAQQEEPPQEEPDPPQAESDPPQAEPDPPQAEPDPPQAEEMKEEEKNLLARL